MSNNIDKTKAVKTVKLINVNGENNNNKYWCCWVMENWSLYVEYGRVGSRTPGTHIYPTSSQLEAEGKLNSLIRDKSKKGYVEACIEQESETELDCNLLGANYSGIQQSIERLTSIGQQVKPHSQISFNKTKGQFESNLGVISTATIQKAKAALSKVEQNLRSPESLQFTQAAEEYLKIIQIPTGTKLRLAELLGNREKIRRQKLVLDLLSEGIKTIVSTRETILAATAELENNNRSAWMNWGEIETIEEETTIVVDERSRFISWS